jgi:hypothetical protein
MVSLGVCSVSIPTGQAGSLKVLSPAWAENVKRNRRVMVLELALEKGAGD